MKKVGSNPKYLEDMTGLTDLLNDTSLMDGVIGIPVPTDSLVTVNRVSRHISGS